MPYWSSSRVGAVPQGQPTKQKKRTERYNRKKGITMEDLKKQTAIRLAQEQQQQGRPPATSFGAAVPDPLHGSVVTPKQVGRQPSFTESSNHSSGSLSFQSVSNVGTGIPISDDPVYPSNRSLPVTPNPLSSSYRYDQNHVVPVPMSDQVSTPVKQSNSRRYNNSSHSDHVRSAPRPSKSSSSGASDHKPKLPHGLTVHELKAMTKARLQAEASEMRDMSSPETLSSVPTTVQTSVDYRDTHIPSPTMASPPNFARSPYPDHGNYQHTVESWSHDSRNEHWENGSVSTQTSDYVGPEQVFGVPSFNEEPCYNNRVRAFSANNDNDLTYNRVRSFSANADLDSGYNRTRSFSANGIGLPHDFGPLREPLSPAVGQHQSSSFFEGPSSFVANRRRAATLSPRIGLSYLHEDRQVLPGQEAPGIPAFHPTHFSECMNPRTTMNSFMPSDQYRFIQSAGLMGGYTEGNRQRTNSAVSLPAMSHTAEEFALEHIPSRVSHFSILPEHCPSSRVTGLSDVFRESPDKSVPAPPGFIGGADFRVPPALSSGAIAGMDSFAESRSSTWGESSSNIFGPSLIGGTHVDPLADDLASILKLSGAEERDASSPIAPPPGLL